MEGGEKGEGTAPQSLLGSLDSATVYQAVQKLPLFKKRKCKGLGSLY